jgi:hypothetical protein
LLKELKQMSKSSIEESTPLIPVAIDDQFAYGENPFSGSLSIQQRINLWLASLVGVGLAQILHEAFHGITAVLVGGSWDRFSFWAVDTSLPEGAENLISKDGLISGLAAPLNIVVAFCAAVAFRLTAHPTRRLVAFYLAAYSGFLGFGYLLIDPLFANEDSLGDWARVTMLLGGGLWIRLAIIAVGLAGTIFGYFWMGQSASRLLSQADGNPVMRRRNAFMVCMFPYLVNNLIFSLLAVFHPLGSVGFFISLSQYWLGYCGFVWSFMITFVWSEPNRIHRGECLIPSTVSSMLLAAVVLLCAVIAILL